MMKHRSVRMELMSSKEIGAYLKENDVVILPVGCIEMHGPKIPLGCDAIHAWATAILLAEKWKCVTLPPIYYAYPGASGPWPGTVDISPEITQEYLKQIVKALLRGGFKRVVLCGTHGPLSFIFQMVIRSIYQETSEVVMALLPQVMPDDLMEDEFGFRRGEDVLVLASLKVLGLHGAYDPESDIERPMEFPIETIGQLKKYGASVPWLFAADYQHTGLRKGITLEDADRAIGVMKKAIDRMPQLSELFAKYQKEMKKLTRDKPWLKDDIWSL